MENINKVYACQTLTLGLPPPALLSSSTEPPRDMGGIFCTISAIFWDQKGPWLGPFRLPKHLVAFMLGLLHLQGLAEAPVQGSLRLQAPKEVPGGVVPACKSSR